MPRSRYPGIYRATEVIALDNGGINRFRSIDQHRRELARFLDSCIMSLDAIDAFLVGLSEEDMNELCCGCGGEGEPEQVALLNRAPPFTKELLNEIFEKVC